MSWEWWTACLHLEAFGAYHTGMFQTLLRQLTLLQDGHV